MGKTLDDEEARSLGQFLSLLSAHLKTWEMGEWLSKEKAQQMAAIAREWEYRLTDRVGTHPLTNLGHRPTPRARTCQARSTTSIPTSRRPLLPKLVRPTAITRPRPPHRRE